MTNLKRLLVGAIAILATTTVIPTVGASASTWNSSNLNKSISQTGTVSAQTASTTTRQASVASASQADGWNFTSVDDITFKKDGKLVTDWSKGGDNVEWRYYDKSTGVMKTGWLNDNGTWYYLYADGHMAHDTYINGYYLDVSGAYDASKNDSSKVNYQTLKLYTSSSLVSSKSISDAEFTALRSQDKIGVSVHYAQGTGGDAHSGLDFFLK